MSTSGLLQRQSQRLLQLGMALFLYSSLDGFVSRPRRAAYWAVGTLTQRATGRHDSGNWALMAKTQTQSRRSPSRLLESSRSQPQTMVVGIGASAGGLAALQAFVVAASSGYDARAALEMSMAVHESQRLQRRVTFPLEN